MKRIYVSIGALITFMTAGRRMHYRLTRLQGSEHVSQEGGGRGRPRRGGDGGEIGEYRSEVREKRG